MHTVPSAIPPCHCLDAPLPYTDYTTLSLGVDMTDGRFADVTLQHCRRCGRHWLHYHLDYEHLPQSGRFLMGLITPEQAQTMSPDQALVFIEALDWHLYGGSYYGQTGKVTRPPLNTDNQPMSDLLTFAQDVAQSAAALLRDRYEGVLDVSAKSSAIDLVTDVDQASEALIVGRIRERYPDHLIYAEETAQDDAVLQGPGPVWLVDPLDGTVNYAHGFPVFAVSVALAVGGRPVVAVTIDALRGEVFTAAAGQGAWVNGRRLQVTRRVHLGESLLATGFPYTRATEPDNNLDAFNYLMPRTRGVRRAGSACLDLAWVAAGRLDGYWEMYLKPYDFAAGWLLVEEAGGRVTDFAGQPWQLHQPVARMVASNSTLHDELLTAVQTARQAR